MKLSNYGWTICYYKDGTETNTPFTEANWNVMGINASPYLSLRYNGVIVTVTNHRESFDEIRKRLKTLYAKNKTFAGSDRAINRL